MPRVKPDFSTGPSDHTIRWLLPGDQLVRLGYEAYPGDSYNPVIPTPNRSSTPGRFSGTRKDRFACIYAADRDPDESLVILEFANALYFETNPGGVRKYLDREDVLGRCFYYLAVTKPMPVVVLSAARAPDGFGANWGALFGDDYWLSREWARYIRHRVADAKGFDYISVRDRDARDGVAVVLFGDRLPLDGLEMTEAPVVAASSAGRRVFMNCVDKTYVVPQW